MLTQYKNFASTMKKIAKINVIHQLIRKKYHHQAIQSSTIAVSQRRNISWLCEAEIQSLSGESQINKSDDNLKIIFIKMEKYHTFAKFGYLDGLMPLLEFLFSQPISESRTYLRSLFCFFSRLFSDSKSWLTSRTITRNNSGGRRVLGE